MAKKADKSIQDTGERMVPAYHKGHEVYGEHIVRYTAALELVKGKRVLDIACGSGYGSALLATSAKSVVGVDIDKDAIKYAKSNYDTKNTTYVLGSATEIPLKDNEVDVVVSFETLEHIEDYRTFMAEIKRVLKNDGLLILSTPNDIEFPESNHFHVHEFTLGELERLVNKYFIHQQTYFQATWIYNALLPADKLGSEWNDMIGTMNTAPISKNKSIYFYMLCSQKAIKEKIAPLAAMSEHWSERTKQEYEESVRGHIEEQGKIIAYLKDKAENNQRQADVANKKLQRIYASKAWKAASTLRRVKRKLLS